MIDKLINKLYHIIDQKENNKWYKYPFGKNPIGTSADYDSLSKDAFKKNYPMIDNFEMKYGYSIDPIWLNKLALKTQIVIKKSELCFQHGRVLYTVLSNYINYHKKQSSVLSQLNILETGTARGFSSLCMAKAMHDMRINGKIFTFDVLPHFSRMYWNCIEDAIGPKSRAELLTDWEDLIEKYIIFIQGDVRINLPKIQIPRINFAFLDGGHEYDDIIFEFSQINPYQLPGDIIVFDDYNKVQFPGLVSAVNEVCETYNYHIEVIAATKNREYVIATKS